MTKTGIVLAGVGLVLFGGVTGFGVATIQDRLDTGSPGADSSRGRMGNVDSSEGGPKMMGGGREGMRQGRNQKDGSGGGFGFGGGSGRGGCYGDGCLSVDDFSYPAGELREAAKQALASAIDDEYKAYSTYQSIMGKYGSVRPFIMISRAEEMHISALESLHDKYGVTVPGNPYGGKIVAPSTIQEACKMGVEAEKANVTLYQESLLPAVTEYPDISSVFRSLSSASQTRHLPAFERCSN